MTSGVERRGRNDRRAAVVLTTRRAASGVRSAARGLRRRLAGLGDLLVGLAGLLGELEQVDEDVHGASNNNESTACDWAIAAARQSANRNCRAHDKDFDLGSCQCTDAGESVTIGRYTCSVTWRCTD